MSRGERWRGVLRRIRIDAEAVYLAARDQRTPWYAKVAAFLVAAYAFSPIDLIPDFIPIIGYLDDIILVPLGVALVVRLVPDDVWSDCRRRAEERVARKGRVPGVLAAAVVVAIWAAAGFFLWRWISG